MLTRSALLWDITRHRVVIVYQHFRTTSVVTVYQHFRTTSVVTVHQHFRTSVNNYHTTLHTIPQEHGSHVTCQPHSHTHHDYKTWFLLVKTETCVCASTQASILQLLPLNPSYLFFFYNGVLTQNVDNHVTSVKSSNQSCNKTVRTGIGLACWIRLHTGLQSSRHFGQHYSSRLISDLL
jgi:hypothetical protein